MNKKMLVLIIALVLAFGALFAWLFTKDKEESGKLNIDDIIGEIEDDEKGQSEDNESNKTEDENSDNGDLNSDGNDNESTGNGDEEEKLYYGGTTNIDGIEIQSYKTLSGIKINENAFEIAKNLGFELQDFYYYINLTEEDLTSYEKTYDILRGMNIYIAADDLWFQDRADMIEVYEKIKSKYMKLKYEGATTNNYDAVKFGLNGNKPEKEKKLDDYSYLLGAKALPAVFFNPRELASDDTKFFEKQDEVKKISSGELDEAWQAIAKKSDEYQKTLNDVQKEDLNKINEVVAAYNKAYETMDYNAYAKILTKEYRESFGPQKISEIKDKLYINKIKFVINHIDEKAGIAVGYAFNTTASLVTLGTVEETDLEEAFYFSIDRMAFRENIKGEWELYYQYETRFYD